MIVSCQVASRRADRDYVRILHLAATTSETEVETALTLLLEASTFPASMLCVIWSILLTPPSPGSVAHLIWTFRPMISSFHQGELMPKTTNRPSNCRRS